MNNNFPLISIIIPTYQRPDNLLRAISSAQKQTYPNIEIIVVDDNGIDSKWHYETEKILSSLIEHNVIKYVVHEINKNGSAARNTGFRVAKGDYINFLDDDDEFLPEKLKAQYEELQKHDNTYGGCYCNSRIFGINRKFETNYVASGNIIEDILCGNVDFNTSSVLFRRSALETINGFDESFWRHQDWELYVRFFRLYNICVSGEKILMNKYSTPNEISKRPQRIIDYKEYFLSVYKDDIAKMNKKRYIYKHQYIDTALTLFGQGLKNNACKYLFKSMHYGFPSLWNLSKILYYLIFR